MLRYGLPNRMGRLLNNMDVAYDYGKTWPKSKKGRHLISGEVTSGSNGKRERAAGAGTHPTPRHAKHVYWLVKTWADGCVIDPFCGSSTTLQAAYHQGLPSIGIDINEEYCEIAVNRLKQRCFNFK